MREHVQKLEGNWPSIKAFESLSDVPISTNPFDIDDDISIGENDHDCHSRDPPYTTHSRTNSGENSSKAQKTPSNPPFEPHEESDHKISSFLYPKTTQQLKEDFQIPLQGGLRDSSDEEDIYQSVPRIATPNELKQIYVECERKPVIVLPDTRATKTDENMEYFRKLCPGTSKPKISPSRPAPLSPPPGPMPPTSGFRESLDNISPLTIITTRVQKPAARNRSIFGGGNAWRGETTSSNDSNESVRSPLQSPTSPPPEGVREKRRSLLKSRVESYNSIETNKHRKEYNYAVMEFIDKVESTIQTLEELDNFYSKLGNMGQYKHIIDSWPPIHRTSLPQIIAVHHRFIAQSGATGNDIFTNQTNRELIDIMEIPQLIMDVYLTSKEFSDIYGKYTKEIAFDPIPKTDRNFQILSEEFMKHTSDPCIRLLQAVGLPYDRLFNFQELVKKLAKCAHRGNLANKTQCLELEKQYVAFMKRIQTSFEQTTQHVNNTEAFYELQFPSKRQFRNDKLESHILAAGDIKYNGKIYRLSLWTDRLYIAKYKETPEKATHIVHRECYRCMIGQSNYTEAETAYDSPKVKLVIYSFLANSDNKTRQFKALEPKRFEFEAVSSRENPYKAEILWYTQGHQWRKAFRDEPLPQYPIHYAHENEPKFTLKNMFTSEDGICQFQKGEKFTAKSKLLDENRNPVFEGYMGEFQTPLFQLPRSQLDIDKKCLFFEAEAKRKTYNEHDLDELIIKDS